MKRIGIAGILISTFICVTAFSAQADSLYSDGTLKWSFSTGGSVGYSSPAISDDGTIYIASEDPYGGSFYKLFAVASNGTKMWDFSFGSSVRDAAPSIARDGTIYIGSDDHNVYAIRPDGTQRWAFKTSDVVGLARSMPAIGNDGTVYVGTGNPYIGTGQGSLYAINPDGTQKWVLSSSSTAGGWSPVAISKDGAIYSAAYDGKLHALGSNGTEKWAVPINSWWGQAPSIGADGTVYVGSNNGNLHAIGTDGIEKWSFETGAAIGAGVPIIGPDGVIYVASINGKVYAINPDGTQKWVAPYSSGGTFALGSDGTLYVGGYDDLKIKAVDSRNGTLKWEFKAGGAIAGSPAISRDGTIYFGSWDGKLYALYSSSGGLADSAWPMAGHDLRHTANQSTTTWTLYDDFGSGLIDPEKWVASDNGSQLRERAMLVSSKKLNLLQRSYGTLDSNTGTSPADLKVTFANSPKVMGIKALVKPTAFEATGCSGNTACTSADASLLGYFFNTNPQSNGSRNNDVFASVGVVRDSKSKDAENTGTVFAKVGQCQDDACGTVTYLYSKTLGKLTKESSAVLSVEWDAANHKFLFKRDSKSLAFSYDPTTYPDESPPAYNNKSLGVSSAVANCQSSPRPTAFMNGFFDNVCVKALTP
jgi:outer membrane protein assembly factor BamB